jgi:hypothetical protein
MASNFVLREPLPKPAEERVSEIATAIGAVAPQGLKPLGILTLCGTRRDIGVPWPFYDSKHAFETRFAPLSIPAWTSARQPASTQATNTCRRRPRPGDKRYRRPSSSRTQSNTGAIMNPGVVCAASALVQTAQAVPLEPDHDCNHGCAPIVQAVVDAVADGLSLA